MKRATKRVVKSTKRAAPKSAGVKTKSVSARKTEIKEKAKRAAREADVRVTRGPSKPTPSPAPQKLISDSEAMQSYESAVRLFRAGDFQKAKEVFDQIAAGAWLEVAHSARSYSKMCEARLMRRQAEPKTAEEFYTYGVALTNQRKLAEAKVAFESAARLDPQADHIHYAMALCLGLAGDLEGAARSLRTAISLNSRNRALARSDPDFAEIIRKRPVADVLATA